MKEKRTINYAFRIVHIDNIPYIEDVGFVLPSSPFASENYKPIGDSIVIEKRKLKPNGVDLIQYIPFYLGPRSVMLYVIQRTVGNIKFRCKRNFLNHHLIYLLLTHKFY